VLAEETDVAAALERDAIDGAAVLKAQMIPRGPRVHRVSRELLIQAGVEDDIGARLGEPVVRPQKQHPLPSAGCAEAQAVCDLVLASDPDAVAILVLLKIRIR